MNSFACVGDRTDHGGTILTGSAGGDVEGRRIACLGDKVQCPKCGGIYPIISSRAPFLTFDGVSAAFHGDKTACGATIIASQILAGAHQDSGPASSEVSPATFSESSHVPQKSYKGRFQVLDDTTGEPVRSRSYTVTASDGQTITGKTDDQGLTDWVEGANPLTLKITSTGDA